MLKRFFKKVVNKVKEVVNMVINTVVEREEMKKAAIVEVVKATSDVVIHTEDLLAGGVKGAVNLGKDTVKGAVNLGKDTVKGAVNLKKEKVKVLSNIISNIKSDSTRIGIVVCICGTGIVLSVGAGLIAYGKLA